MPIRDLLINGGLVLGGAYVLVCVLLIVFARTLIYPFAPGVDASEPMDLPGAEAVTFEAADGTPLIAWIVPPAPGRPVVLSFMGNGGSLPAHAALLAGLAERGLGIAALNYRGAGGAPGSPTQPALIADALTLYDRLDALLGEAVPPARRVIHGTSLGAAVAVQLAAERAAAAVVLDSPFRRLCEVGRIHYPIFPVCLLLPYERWNSAARIGQIDAPLLVLHGTEDAVIPVSQGRALFAEAREPKRMIVYEGGGHNDLYLQSWAEDVARFIAEAVPGRQRGG